MFAASLVLFISGWLRQSSRACWRWRCWSLCVLDPQQAVKGFGSPALITLMGLFALSAGLFRSGGVDRLRAILGSESVKTPRRMILLLVAVVSPLSGFIPNTPIVATLLPVLENWCHRRGISPSKVMLPMSFAVVIGGTITLLGTSTNLLASDVAGSWAMAALTCLISPPSACRFGCWAPLHGGGGRSLAARPRSRR